MRPRLPSFLVGGIGLALAAGLYVLGKPAAPAGMGPSALASVAASVDAELREMIAGLRSRAQTLADLPRLAVAVATDAATVQDLTADELAFRLKPGETIEIGQITESGTVSLLRKPNDSKASPPLDKTGTMVTAAPGGFMLSEVVSIKPTVQTGILRGAIAVSWFLDARPLLAQATLPTRLEMGGTVLASSATPFREGAETVTLPIESKLAAGLALVEEKAPAPSGTSTLQLLGFAAGALGLLVAVGLSFRKPRKAARPRPAAMSPDVTPAGDAFTPAAAYAATSEMPASTTPQQFGRYTIVRRLGSGGMAEVFLARGSGEAGFQKDVALKIMHRNLSQVPEVVDHFLDEARLASRLSHPNIVQIIDLGKAGDDYFIAMEFVDGYDLDYILDRAQARGALVSPRVALAVARKICLGLHAAHGAVAGDGSPLDIVHRDVKAENVLISRRGEVKVADFGIAKANQRSRVTQLGMVKGTAAYMAPEHRMGRPVDRRADVYGVGAVLYELLTGTEINLDLETLAHLGREGWPHLKPVSEIRADVPAGIDAIVWKALAFDREDRFPSCGALEEELERFAVTNGIEAGEKAVAQWIETEIAFLERAS